MRPDIGYRIAHKDNAILTFLRGRKILISFAVSGKIWPIIRKLFLINAPLICALFGYREEDRSIDRSKS